MPMRPIHAVSAAALFAACSLAMGVETAATLPSAAVELQSMYPGVRVHAEQGRVRTIYGVPMTPGMTAHDAATTFLTTHGGAFGVGNLELDEAWTTPTGDGRFTSFGYRQKIDGNPVEYGNARVLVLNGPVPQVVLAGGTLAARPDGGFAAPRLDGQTALKIAQADRLHQGLEVWSQPELAIFQGVTEPQDPVLVWKVMGMGASPVTDKTFTFFVDASTGFVVHVRNDVVNTDVGGTIKGMGSPGVFPDANYNPPALMDMPEIRATIAGGNNAFSDRTGVFSILNPGTAAVTVSTSTNSSNSGGGRWVNVIPAAGSAITSSLGGVLPPGPANLTLNPSPTEFSTSQVNAFVGTTLTHNYFKDRAPGFTALDIVIPANVNIAQTCNANFNPGNLTINFFAAGGGCVNTAFSTVVAHEYGHFIVNRLGLSQGAFGEGFGDSVAELIYDDSVLGRGFSGQGTAVRNPLSANIQVPCNASCGGAVHCCGQQLPALWWRILTNMRGEYGTGLGMDLTRQMHVSWALVTNGGNGTNAIGPATAIEVLTVNDTDGNLSNGTPDYTRICSAFEAGGVACPAISPLVFTYPNGRPASVTPGQPTTIAVNVGPNAGTSPQSGSGTLTYRIGGGSFTTIPMTEVAPNQYTATLPAATCPQTIDYYFGAQTTAAVAAMDPAGAPGTFFSTVAGTVTTVADLNFQADPAWTVTNTALTTGQWERVTPHNPPSTGCPGADADGSGMCWVTDNRVGNFDVDGGPTVLTTGAYDLSAYPSATVSFARWFTSINGTIDTLVFQRSFDNGATWTTLETTGPATGWNVRSFTLTNPTAQTRFRWSTVDAGTGSVTEAGIDAFKVVGVSCAPTGCYANCDNSTSQPVLNVLDFNCFLNTFSAGCP